VAYFINKDGKL